MTEVIDPRSVENAYRNAVPKRTRATQELMRDGVDDIPTITTDDDDNSNKANNSTSEMVYFDDVWAMTETLEESVVECVSRISRGVGDVRNGALFLGLSFPPL